MCRTLQRSVKEASRTAMLDETSKRIRLNAKEVSRNDMTADAKTAIPILCSVDAPERSPEKIVGFDPRLNWLPRVYKLSPEKVSKNAKKELVELKDLLNRSCLCSVVIPAASNISPTRATDSLLWSKLVKERKKDDGPGWDSIQVVSMAQKKKNKRK